MEIKLQFSGNAAMRNQAVHKIIVGSMNCLRAFIEIYRAATPEAIQAYFAKHGSVEDEEIPEELFLEHVDSILSNIDISELLRIDRDIGHLGTKTPVEKYWAAVEFLDVQVQDLKQHIMAYNVYTTNMLAILRSNLKDYIGDLAYALACNAFDPYTNIDVLETDEEIVCDQLLADALATLYPGDKNAVMSFAKELADIQEEFTTSAPIEDLNPSAWEAMSSSCTPDVRIQLSDYGKYITSLDARAFAIGCLSIDENFLDVLRARKNCVEFMGNVIPNAWTSFVKLIPESMFGDFYELELKINQEEVKDCVESGSMPDNFFDDVRKRLDLAGGADNDYTSIFTRPV